MQVDRTEAQRAGVSERAILVASRLCYSVTNTCPIEAKYTGRTGKYAGASGGGTYTFEELTDTLAGGKYEGAIELP